MLSKFSILNPNLNKVDVKYGVQQIKDIFKQFKDFSESSEQQNIDEWKLAKEYLNRILQGMNVKRVCEFAVQDELFYLLENKRIICKIAMSIHINSCWPQRGFSCMLLVKTKKRKRISSFLLSYLMNIQINKP